MERIDPYPALILIVYRRPDISTYEKTVVYLRNSVYEYDTGNPIADIERAVLDAVYNDATSLVYRDECDEFVEDSNGVYAFNLDGFLVRVQEVQGV